MHTALIIGAGPAGLAAAAALKAKGVKVEVLEKSDKTASSWHNHYDRLHLHTPAKISGLPGMAYPESAGKYPPRAEVIAYLEAYAAKNAIVPQFGTDVSDVSQSKTGWRITSTQGTHDADIVVIATGMANAPHVPDFDGLGSFPGQQIHSKTYKNPTQITGQNVLVIGFGNSGGEIALDLAEQGKTVTMAVRSPVQIIPKEILGIPITSLGLLQKLFNYKTVDAINAPVLRMVLGDYTKLGLKKAPKGPIAMIKENGRIPLIDIGTLAAIRAGKIKVEGNVTHIAQNTITFEGGTTQNIDAIVMATGYRPRLNQLLKSVNGVLDETGRPLVSGGPTAAKGLFFISQKVTPNGQLRQAGIEAQAIAEAL